MLPDGESPGEGVGSSEAGPGNMNNFIAFSECYVRLVCVIYEGKKKAKTYKKVQDLLPGAGIGAPLAAN